MSQITTSTPKKHVYNCCSSINMIVILYLINPNLVPFSTLFSFQYHKLVPTTKKKHLVVMLHILSPPRQKVYSKTSINRISLGVCSPHLHDSLAQKKKKTPKKY